MVAAAHALLSASAPESPQALGSSFDATRRLKCLGLRERSSWDKQCQQYREIGTTQINGEGLPARLRLIPTLPVPFHPGQTHRRELYFQAKEQLLCPTEGRPPVRAMGECHRELCTSLLLPEDAGVGSLKRL